MFTGSEVSRSSKGQLLARLAVSIAAVVALLVPAPLAGAHDAASLTLYVKFGYDDSITVTLADGTPVGVKSGTPTVIPAGFYTVSLTQPGCVDVPYFNLKGPGVNISDNLSGGEVLDSTDDAYFQPNATYTWSNDDNRGVTYTFQTSGDVVGTPPPPAPAIVQLGPAPKPGSISNTSVVGSGVKRSLATLAGTVTASGRLELALHGKSITSLKHGRYLIAVTDHSNTTGFFLARAGHATLSASGAAFVGRRTVAVTLTKGRWSFMPKPARPQFTVAVT
jgi:hypothetical protein